MTAPTGAETRNLWNPTGNRSAFTLVELVIVILILGILAGVAAPKFVDITQEANRAAILRNIDSIFDAAEIFKAQNGQFPADADSGDVPSDFAGMLPDRLFTDTYSYGGPYDWDGPGGANSDYGVTLQLNPGASGLQLYYSMDQALDDGSTTGGWIRAGAGGTVRFLIDP